MPTKEYQHCIEACDSLLRGEISAIETYNQAIEKFKGDPEVSLLEKVRHEHIDSANQLRRHIHEMGGEPSRDSGPWGTWATAVEGTAKLLGNSAALKALQEGEEHGEKEYRETLDDEDVMASIKTIIRNDLLPRQIRHVSILQGLRKAQ